MLLQQPRRFLVDRRWVSTTAISGAVRCGLLSRGFDHRAPHGRGAWSVWLLRDRRCGTTRRSIDTATTAVPTQPHRLWRSPRTMSDSAMPKIGTRSVHVVRMSNRARRASVNHATVVAAVPTSDRKRRVRTKRTFQLIVGGPSMTTAAMARTDPPIRSCAAATTNGSARTTLEIKVLRAQRHRRRVVHRR